MICAGSVGFDEEGIFQAVLLAIVVEEGFPGDIFPVDFAIAFPLEEQGCGSVKIEITGIPGFVGEPQFVSGLAENVFLIDELNFVAFVLVIDERAIEIGFIEDVTEIEFAHGLDAGIGSEGIIDPTGGLAVVNANESLAVQGNFHVQLEGAHALDEEGTFGVRAEGDGAGDAFGFDGFDFVQATAGGDVFGNDVVYGLGGQRQGGEEEGGEEE